MSESAASPEGPVFQERPTEFIVRDAFVLGALPLALAGVAGALGWQWLGGVLLGCTAFVAAFFRNPPRFIEGDERSVVAPADGRVLEAGEIELPDGSKAKRVGIFLSVFNVHVNRAPCDGRVTKTIYKPGKFINAMKHDDASADNESNTVVLAEPHGQRPVAVVKQIVGLIARRIICTVKESDTVHRGDRIGMIKFGSRTELYIPKWLEPEVKVKVGDTVRGAADVIATLKQAIVTDAKEPIDEEFEPLVGRETPA